MVASQATTKWSFRGSNLPVDTVTVYRPSGAQIIRKLDLELEVSQECRLSDLLITLRLILYDQAGYNVIEITDLSSDIDLESFRVSGLGTARLLVVTCFLDPRPDITTSDPIRTLRAQVRELKDEKDALEAEIPILKGFGRNMAKMPDLNPDSAEDFADKLLEKTLSNAAAVRELDAKIIELERKIDKLDAAKVNKADTRATITVVANEAGPAQLRLTYRESSARRFRGAMSTCF